MTSRVEEFLDFAENGGVTALRVLEGQELVECEGVGVSLSRLSPSSFIPHDAFCNKKNKLHNNKLIIELKWHLRAKVIHAAVAKNRKLNYIITNSIRTQNLNIKLYNIINCEILVKRICSQKFSNLF